MSLFKKKKARRFAGSVDSAVLAQRALDFIAEGVMLVDASGTIQFANPGAATMAGYDDPANIIGLDYQLIIRLETDEGVPVEPTQSSLYTAIKTNANMTTRDYLLVSAQAEHRVAVSLSCIPTGAVHDLRIVTFRDITKELAEENEQAEFISTASHEMRTPVASIEGYLGLALNPQTATIDSRAKQYLDAAHAASQHLGHLFKDLLDVTKLDDKRLKPHYVPVDAVEVVRRIAGEREKDIRAKNLQYSFGAGGAALFDKNRIEPKVYMAVDMDFLHEILDNLMENAIKYTPEGGQIWVNARGDGDKVLINVTDNGIGVSPEDAGHIFQKFYRVDNSQTRQIGGTGLGLYLVKQRVEAMGGRVWLESSFGDGSTFFVSLPRISESEYEKMKIAQANEQMVKNFSAPNRLQGQPTTITSAQVGLAPGQVLPAAAAEPQIIKYQDPALGETPVGNTEVTPAANANTTEAGVGAGSAATSSVTLGAAAAGNANPAPVATAGNASAMAPSNNTAPAAMNGASAATTASSTGTTGAGAGTAGTAASSTATPVTSAPINVATASNPVAQSTNSTASNTNQT